MRADRDTMQLVKLKRLSDPLEVVMRRRCTFRKTDVMRATKAVQATGLQVARVEVWPDGLIVVVPGKPSDIRTPAGDNEWDELLNGEHSASVR
jgi:hypothetical protein